MKITEYWVVDYFSPDGTLSPNQPSAYSPFLRGYVGPVFSTQAFAEASARHNGTPPIGKPRPADQRDWKAVMTYRMDAGVWSRITEWSEFMPQEFERKHFVHVSTTDPSKVAFVESEEKGQADRITVMKPGRFLTKYFGDVLNADEISRIANRYVARTSPGQLKFAKTGDEIEEVYINGPHSCMAGDDFNIHPARVYAGPDLAVAYILRGDDITARAVVWPEKKRWVRLYGDEHRLETALKDIGYSRGDLEGARIQRIETDWDELVCPYLDSIGRVEDEGEYLRITNNGSYFAQNTEGLLSGQCCDRCERNARQLTTVLLRRHSSEEWCDNCLDDAAYCEDEEAYVYAERTITLANDRTVSEWYFEDNCFTCEGNEENYHNKELVVLATGEEWSEDHFGNHGFHCALSNDAYRLEDGVQHPEYGMIHKERPEAQALLEEQKLQLELELEAA